MASALWKGSVSFGLVNIPVVVYTATTENKLKFNQLNSKTNARIKQPKVDGETGEKVDWDDIVSGYEISDGRYVVIYKEELAGLLKDKQKVLKLTGFVSLSDIDPLLYDKSYYLVADDGGGEGYRLISRALRDSGKVGIGQIVMRGREYLVAVRAGPDDVLVLSTLHFENEVLPANQYATLQGEVKEPDPRALKMAKQIIEEKKTVFNHGDYRDEYQAELRKLVDQKAAGEETIVLADAPELAPAVDLLSALEASLATPKPKTAPKRTRTKVAA